MTGPSRADVGAMAYLLKALNGDKSGLKAQTEAQQSQGGNEIMDVSPGVKTADIKAMENIMRNFHSCEFTFKACCKFDTSRCRRFKNLV